jgi:hypothetical protein
VPLARRPFSRHSIRHTAYDICDISHTF